MGNPCTCHPKWYTNMCVYKAGLEVQQSAVDIGNVQAIVMCRRSLAKLWLRAENNWHCSRKLEQRTTDSQQTVENTNRTYYIYVYQYIFGTVYGYWIRIPNGSLCRFISSLKEVKQLALTCTCRKNVTINGIDIYLKLIRIYHKNNINILLKTRSSCFSSSSNAGQLEDLNENNTNLLPESVGNFCTVSAQSILITAEALFCF